MSNHMASNQMAQLQEATIKAQCKTLRMPMIASQFGTLAEQAIREKKSHVGYLEALLLAEIEERERNTKESLPRRLFGPAQKNHRAVPRTCRGARGWQHRTRSAETGARGRSRPR
jgi:DNA replication protein DnaC